MIRLFEVRWDWSRWDKIRRDMAVVLLCFVLFGTPLLFYRIFQYIMSLDKMGPLARFNI